MLVVDTRQVELFGYRPTAKFNVVAYRLLTFYCPSSKHVLDMCKTRDVCCLFLVSSFSVFVLRSCWQFFAHVRKTRENTQLPGRYASRGQRTPLAISV